MSSVIDATGHCNKFLAMQNLNITQAMLKFSQIQLLIN